jgi:GTP-binding protein
VPFGLIFTKSDRLGSVTIQNNVDAFLAQLSETWETLPPYFVTSSEYRTGREDVLNFIGKTIRQLKG